MRPNTLISASLCVCVSACGQQSNQTWVHQTESGGTIALVIGDSDFIIDTIDFYEGVVYYFKSTKDSSYFRVNSISEFAKYECCSDGNYYIELNSINNNDIHERNGKIKSKELYWREIIRSDVMVVYNNCPEPRLAEYNKIMNSAIKSPDGERVR